MTQFLQNPEDSTQEPLQSYPPEKNEHHLSRFQLSLLFFISLLLVGVGVTTWYFLFRSDSDVLKLSGRLEGYPTDLDAEVSGRVTSITVREGDYVEQGAVVAQLDKAELQARLKSTTARLGAAQQRKRQASLELDVIKSQIQQAQLNQQQATGNTQGRILQAEENVATAEAKLAQAQAQLNQKKAELKLAQADRDRYIFLVQEGAIAEQQFDKSQTTFETAHAAVTTQEAVVVATRREVRAARGALVEARSTAFNPEIYNAQVQELRSQLQVAQAKLAIAQAEAEDAQANQQEILAQLKSLEIISPISGIVTTRVAEPGTVVGAGSTLLTVLDPNSVYLRGFIPGGQVGQVCVRQPAKVYLDSFPNRPLKAMVMAIDSEASFTPENIYFKEDRVQQVFGVNIKIIAPEGLAKPGMPADAEIMPNVTLDCGEEN